MFLAKAGNASRCVVFFLYVISSQFETNRPMNKQFSSNFNLYLSDGAKVFFVFVYIYVIGMRIKYIDSLNICIYLSAGWNLF